MGVLSRKFVDRTSNPDIHYNSGPQSNTFVNSYERFDIQLSSLVFNFFVILLFIIIFIFDLFVYAIGETVCIKIQNADHNNTDARLLPCKVYKVTLKNDKKCYRIYSASGKLKNTFTGEELVDMKNVVFSALATADPSTFEEVFIMLASREVTNGRPAKKVHDMYSARAVASQTGTFVKEKGMKCFTKCHTNSMACQNNTFT